MEDLNIEQDAESQNTENEPGVNSRKQEPEDEQKLEEIFAQVEQCIEQLENPQISLEDSFRYYEEGIRKLKICNSKVAQIEQQMLVINGQGELENF